MKRIALAAATLVFLLGAASGCGGSSSSGSSSSSTTAGSTAGNEATTTAAAGGGDVSAFCSMLADGTDTTAAFMASVGTPDQAAELASVKADNDAIVAAAPADISAAVTKFYAISETARAALDPNLSAADKRTAGAAAAAAATTPEAKAAIADYRTWVTANCGDLSTKILAGGA